MSIGPIKIVKTHLSCIGCTYFAREIKKDPRGLMYVKICYHVKAPGDGHMGEAHETQTPYWCPEIKRKRKLKCTVR